MPRLVAAVVFWPLLAVWTWQLVEPRPFPEIQDGLKSYWNLLPFIAAKCLHAGVYAFLAALLWVWVPIGRTRWVAVGMLMAHGIGTEIAQYLMDVGRVGSVKDVLIDWSGIAAGLLLARRFWR